MKTKSKKITPEQLEVLLSGPDLRSLGNVRQVIAAISNQVDFDVLFRFFSHPDRTVVMRTADAVEKISAVHPDYLVRHKETLLNMAAGNLHDEIKWHLAQIIPLLKLDAIEFSEAWNLLWTWALDKTNSRIVRVNSLEGLFKMTRNENSLQKELEWIMDTVGKENIPSINARTRIIRKRIKNPAL